MLQTEPQIQEVLGIAEKGHDYFLQITDARPDTGGLSGATPAEAVSWGKVDPDTLPSTVVCYLDSHGRVADPDRLRHRQPQAPQAEAPLRPPRGAAGDADAALPASAQAEEVTDAMTQTKFARELDRRHRRGARRRRNRAPLVRGRLHRARQGTRQPGHRSRHRSESVHPRGDPARPSRTTAGSRRKRATPPSASASRACGSSTRSTAPRSSSSTSPSSACASASSRTACRCWASSTTRFTRSCSPARAAVGSRSTARRSASAHSTTWPPRGCSPAARKPSAASGTSSRRS